MSSTMNVPAKGVNHWERRHTPGIGALRLIASIPVLIVCVASFTATAGHAQGRCWVRGLDGACSLALPWNNGEDPSFLDDPGDSMLRMPGTRLAGLAGGISGLQTSPVTSERLAPIPLVETDWMETTKKLVAQCVVMAVMLDVEGAKLIIQHLWVLGVIAVGFVVVGVVPYVVFATAWGKRIRSRSTAIRSKPSGSSGSEPAPSRGTNNPPVRLLMKQGGRLHGNLVSAQGRGSSQAQALVDEMTNVAGDRVSGSRYWKCPECGTRHTKSGLGKAVSPGDRMPLMMGFEICNGCGAGALTAHVYAGMWDD